MMPNDPKDPKIPKDPKNPEIPNFTDGFAQRPTLGSTISLPTSLHRVARKNTSPFPVIAKIQPCVFSSVSAGEPALIQIINAGLATFKGWSARSCCVIPPVQNLLGRVDTTLCFGTETIALLVEDVEALTIALIVEEALTIALFVEEVEAFALSAMGAAIASVANTFFFLGDFFTLCVSIVCRDTCFFCALFFTVFFFGGDGRPKLLATFFLCVLPNRCCAAYLPVVDRTPTQPNPSR